MQTLVEYTSSNVTRNNTYIGQSGRLIPVRHKEHLHYIRSNNPTSAYTMHIWNNRHEFGTAEETLKLLKPCNKGTRMNCWEALFMHMYHKHNILISEQQITDSNPLFQLGHIPYAAYIMLHVFNSAVYLLAA